MAGATTTVHTSKENGLTQQKRGPSIHEIYSLPAPVRTFPLPAFFPNNPLSLFHLAYAWLGQVFRPPPAEPSVIHRGVWSAATNSIHITDEKSMRALWEQGFYGKGSLSRSEPSWLKREQVRSGLGKGHVSEIVTVQRRDERAQAKWERARLEQEAIRKTRLKEAMQTEDHHDAKAERKPNDFSVISAPVGPLELLALPNSSLDIYAPAPTAATIDDQANLSVDAEAGRLSPSELTLPGGLLNEQLGMAPSTSRAALDISDLTATQASDKQANGLDAINGILPQGDSKSIASPEISSDSSETKSTKRQKSVRFSPKVESTTFKFSDPPNPNHSAAKANGSPLLNGTAGSGTSDGSKSSPRMSSQPATQTVPDASPEAIVNREHLQLTPEEAFFLVFGLGALVVTDVSGRELSPQELLATFRQYSQLHLQVEPDVLHLGPDDEFLMHYAVYHHFRSLGWVPRAGIKFGVDWLLYTRGPVFDHAEFGLIVIPSYSDPWWKAMGKYSPQKTWQWLHSLVRVLAHVTKSLVLVYVDVPPPPRFAEGLEGGFAAALSMYTVREVMVKRWSSNRNR